MASPILTRFLNEQQLLSTIIYPPTSFLDQSNMLPTCKWGSSRLLEEQQGGKMSRKGGRTFSCFKLLEYSKQNKLQEYTNPLHSIDAGLVKIITVYNGPGIQCKLGTH